MVGVLLAKGADIDAKTTQWFPLGPTPLLLAVKGSHKEVVELLLSCGADVKAFDRYGRQAIDYATKDEIKALLK